MDPIKLGVNKTTTFLLPMLLPESTHAEVFSNNFKQAYVGVLDENDNDAKHIILEFDEDNITPEFFEDFIENFNPKGHLVKETENTLTFDVTSFKGEEIYDDFLKGKYSNFKDKETILEFWGEDKESLLSGILNNDNEIVRENVQYLSTDIIVELKEVHDESWPPPNLFVDEFYEGQ